MVEHGNDSILLVVADGLGGVEAGEEASQRAVEELRTLFLSEESAFDLSKGIYAANTSILKLQNQTGKRMKTTIAAVYVTTDRILCAHVGDSRIYLFNDNKIIYQSVDHSFSQMAVFSGEIKVEEIRTHKDRNKLLQALGVDDELSVRVRSYPKNEVQAILLCSDGFWEYIYENEMCNILSQSASADEWLDKMKSLIQTRVPERNDNNTAITAIL